MRSNKLKRYEITGDFSILYVISFLQMFAMKILQSKQVKYQNNKQCNSMNSVERIYTCLAFDVLLSCLNCLNLNKHSICFSVVINIVKN